MITLLIDALIALAKLAGRALPDRAAPPVDSPPTVDGDAQPAGAGCGSAASAGPGGHPGEASTSQLLTEALAFVKSYRMTNAANLNERGKECVDQVITELADRAAVFAAHGD